jgi:hypothetical protein
MVEGYSCEKNGQDESSLVEDPTPPFHMAPGMSSWLLHLGTAGHCSMCCQKIDDNPVVVW